MSEASRVTIHYRNRSEDGTGGLFLVSGAGTAEERRYAFGDRIEIGRFLPDRERDHGVLLIDEPRVSREHCVIERSRDGRCRIRDTSRNGTWIDGRRLVPSVEMEIEIGQVIRIANLVDLTLQGTARPAVPTGEWNPTVTGSGLSMVTVLVGDIRDYTVLVRSVASEVLQRSVSRVFRRLEEEVTRCGGTVKEYPGDAIVAFWEECASRNHAASACRAALVLDRAVHRLAVDRDVWDVPGYELRMDWALATGCVNISSAGGDRPSGLTMVGEAAVLAFRIEKLADDTTGPILACGFTRAMVGTDFSFRDLGDVQAKGFDEPTPLFALLGAGELPISPSIGDPT